MKTGSMRRALILAHTFNLLVALYFIVISIVSLVQLRWYHQLTISVKVRHIVTSATSYFAFLVLIFAAIILIAIFVINVANFSTKSYVSPNQDATNLSAITDTTLPQQTFETSAKQRLQSTQELDATNIGSSVFNANNNNIVTDRQANILVFDDSTGPSNSNSSLCCSTLLHLISSLSLIIILVVWLLNTGELVKDSITTQLESAYSKYQHGHNGSNHYSVAIDSMQDINNCCGLLEYRDFPHKNAHLNTGQYPGSCCGKTKYFYGANQRAVCLAEEIRAAKQTDGCVTVLAHFYDLISLLVVPVSLICLFVNITIIAMITVSRGYSFRPTRTFDGIPGARFELKSRQTH